MRRIELSGQRRGVAQAYLFQRANDQRIERRQLPRLRRGRPQRQHHSLCAALRLCTQGNELNFRFRAACAPVAAHRLFAARRRGDEPETLLVSLRRMARRLQSADKAVLLRPLKPLAAPGECLASAAAIRVASASGVARSTAPSQFLRVAEGKRASARARIARSLPS